MCLNLSLIKVCLFWVALLWDVWKYRRSTGCSWSLLLLPVLQLERADSAGWLSGKGKRAFIGSVRR